MGDIWRMNSHMESVIKAYKTLAKIPSIVGGRLNSKGNRVTSKWSVRNLDKGKSTHYLIDYMLDESLGVSAQSQFAVDISQELLTAVSPKENFKAVIREEKDDNKDAGKKRFFLEVWSATSLKHSIDLTALDIHGDVYTDSEFGSLDWSPDETKIVYIAEKKPKKSEPFIKRKPAEDKDVDPDKKPVSGKEHVYRNDWGEQLTGKIESVVVVCKLPEETVTVMDSVPGCPGQVRFSPNGENIIGVVWEAKMLGRLGLIYCTNRPSFIFCLTLSGMFRPLSAENKACRSPRFAPNGDLFWLQREANGPHHACHQLVRLAADDMKPITKLEKMDEKVTVIIDIVKTELEISNGIFYGMYCQSLPSKCFSADSKRLIFSTQQQTEIRSYVVDIGFSPNGENIIGVVWEAKMLGRLGLIYCTNRPSFIFCLTLSGMFRPLSGENKACRSPRFAPNGDLFWLQREANGPHHACHQLVRLAADDMKHITKLEKMDEKVTVIIDIVKTELEISNGIFHGIYCQSLPSKCFSADSKRLIFSTQQQTEIRSYVVDIESGRIVDISNNKNKPGSTTVLSVQGDVILATFSSMTTPGQLFVAKLPVAENESAIEWVRVSAPIEAPRSVASGNLQYMALKQDSQESVSCFTAIYFGPDEGKVYPLVVWPHGGPHSAFSNSYSLEAALFNMIGFACLMINYRGSAGAGDSSIFYLPSRVGAADVSDCRLATQKALDQFPVDDKKLLLYGGSHGGFLVCHLSGVYPQTYSATVARNPVIDLASMSNTSDIADWCAVEAGWPFTEAGPLDEEQHLVLRRVSPVAHAHAVRTPTALMLGSKDKRVPHYQGLEYARRLRANGVEVAVYMYEDNHALSSLPVEMDNLLNALDWLIGHVKP